MYHFLENFQKPVTTFHIFILYSNTCISHLRHFKLKSDFWAFQTMKMELREKKFQSDQRSASHFQEVCGAFKQCIACQGRYFKKETVTAPPQSSDSE